MTVNELIEKHINLANKIAWSRKKALPHCVSFDEIQSAAYTGLVMAANRYNPSMGEFKIYASFRIFGEIKDYLRTLFWGGRGESQNVKVSSWDDAFECADEEEPENFDEFFDVLAKNLSPLGKKILRMYYAEDLTMGQIAERVNLSQTRVFQLLKSNLQLLKDNLNLV